jgi:hypothetical protein
VCLWICERVIIIHDLIHEYTKQDLLKDKEAKKLLNMFAKDKQWDEQEVM